MEARRKKDGKWGAARVPTVLPMLHEGLPMISDSNKTAGHKTFDYRRDNTYHLFVVYLYCFRINVV